MLEEKLLTNKQLKRTVYIVNDNASGKVVFVSLDKDEAYDFAEKNKFSITAYKEQTVYGLK